MRHLAVFILVLLLIPSGAQALTFLSGDQPQIDTPIPDDVVASGGIVTINAPVDSLTVAGGTVTVNAPVKSDIIAAGGTLVINGDAGGKVIAAGGDIEVNGNATNVLITGGSIRIGRDAVIQRDAVISGGEVTSEGVVMRNLTVSATTFNNTGTAGNVTFEEREESGLLVSGILVLLAVGLLILGLIFVRFVPDPFLAVVHEVERRPVVFTVLGFIAHFVTMIVLLIIAITIIGIPIALFLGLLFIASMLISTFFVAYALGDAIASRAKWRAGRIWIFILGFVILYILFAIPLLGMIIHVIAMSLGYGGLLSALRGARLFRTGGDEA
ncbi:MAG: hypothetical protein WBH94_05590 [Methanoculleus sp.]|jgi:hypothetical protein|nr:hypothetical protein [Methanomicrobiales archaeon]NQS73041.1 hypothetical protein [Methanoculleus sp.]